MTFGERLRSTREKRGMTQASLAGALGVTQTCVSYWESGRREPNLASLCALFRVLDCSLNFLILGEHYGIIRCTTVEIAPAPVVAGRGRGSEPHGGPERA